MILSYRTFHTGLFDIKMDIITEKVNYLSLALIMTEKSEWTFSFFISEMFSLHACLSKLLTLQKLYHWNENYQELSVYQVSLVVLGVFLGSFGGTLGYFGVFSRSDFVFVFVSFCRTRFEETPIPLWRNDHIFFITPYFSQSTK